MESFCGANCKGCDLKSTCHGCKESDGCPFGAPCMVAGLCKEGKAQYENFQKELLLEMNDLQLEGAPAITQLFPLKGAFVNMALPLPNGETAKFLQDNQIYLGTQVEKAGTDRCYGLAADRDYLLVCEYGAMGADPKLVLVKQLRK